MTEKSRNVISGLHQELENPPAVIPTIDPVRDLQKNVFEFIGEHLKKISKIHQLRDLVQEEIETNIRNKQYSPAEMIGLYRMLTIESGDGTKMIVDLFKPAPGVESFLARNLSEDHTKGDKEADLQSIIKNAPPDLLQKIDILQRFMGGSALPNHQNPVPDRPAVVPVDPDDDDDGEPDVS